MKQLADKYERMLQEKELQFKERSAPLDTEKMRAIYSVERSHLMMQKNVFYPVVGTLCIPDF